MHKPGGKASTGIKLRSVPIRLGAGLKFYHIRSLLDPVWKIMDTILQSASGACEAGDFAWPTSAMWPVSIIIAHMELIYEQIWNAQNTFEMHIVIV